VREREFHRRRVRFRRYYANSSILVITIPTDIHEQLYLARHSQYIVKVALVGLHRNWKTIGSATRRVGGHPGGDGGEGD
jgi:hypothetical protein